jgi:hypothetical protein
MGEKRSSASRDTAQDRRGGIAAGYSAITVPLTAVWPSSLPKRDIAGLPALCVEALAVGRRRSRLAVVARQLDHLLPMWPERAAEEVAAAAGAGLSEPMQRLAAALSQRPIAWPDCLLRAASSSRDAKARLWLLTALAGTDTPEVRSFWLGDLRQRVRTEPASPDAALWFAFLRSFLGGWLSYADFRDCLVQGSVLSAADGKGDYPPALRRVRLTGHPTFAKWYRQVVYEVAHQPDVTLSFGAGGWIRDFPGVDYLRDAIASLEQRADSWWPLHMLRWCSGFPPDDEQVVSSLSEASALTICLVSLVRPDLRAAAEQVLDLPNHQEAVEWLTTASGHGPFDLRMIEAKIRPWAERIGERVSLACGALCSTDPPQDFPGPAEAMARRREFARGLIPGFDRLMENVSCVHALRKEHFDVLCQQARAGQAAAVRALGLWPEKAEESAPLLFRISREGTKQAKRAAQESLELLRARARIEDLAELERRVDLASAWADGGLEGKPGRVWWDVAGHRLKLSVAAGKVALDAFSGQRRLAGIPKAVREAPQYEEIEEARRHLASSYRYFSERFEVAMVGGVRYRGSDFATLLANPIVRSLASRLVLLLDGAPRLWTAGDPLGDKPPTAEFADAGEVSVAHPIELGRLNALSEWQQRVIDDHISQPFKQVFREVYVIGDGQTDLTECKRFAGHSLVARRAFALLRSRGYSPRRGDAVKEWEREGLAAHFRWAGDDDDAGRLLALAETAETVTSGPVWFEGSVGRAIALGEISPILFSETLRDADLLVSRAAAGDFGFTSEETLRLRATLVRYLARTLGITTIYVADDAMHALVEGKRAIYRVHLASASVLLEESRRHLEAGRVFDEAVDDWLGEGMDAGTARVLGVVATLARDEQIRDPVFLAQLR